jgi:hypothetical protein
MDQEFRQLTDEKNGLKKKEIRATSAEMKVYERLGKN